jgi:hypothetical protein
VSALTAMYSVTRTGSSCTRNDIRGAIEVHMVH